jgi:hypothetical protein
MKHIKIQNGIPINYSIEQLFQDYPNAVIYKNSQMPDTQLLASYNVFPLITTEIPIGDVIVEGIPELVGDEWHQTWISRSYTSEENLIKQKEKEQALIEQESKLFVGDAVGKERYNICQSCDSFNKLTTQCKECNCIMLLKTKLQSSKCPINKW